MNHTLIIGGGVVGLSIAYELAKRGEQVTLLERDQIGQKASWAGAGILPPANLETAIHPLEKLAGLSCQLHPQWAADLKSETGIDTGYRRGGGIYIARSSGEAASLTGAMFHWEDYKITFEQPEPERLAQLAPGLKLPLEAQVLWVPAEAQLRNPRHLQALTAACHARGVTLVEQVKSIELIVKDHETEYVLANDRPIKADRVCLCAGAWTEPLVKPFGVPLPMVPVRGQIVLFKLPTQAFVPVINEGNRYMVARTDGHLLAGTTIEEVGFDSRTVPSDIAALKEWAQSLIPECTEANVVKAWAGLRPGTYDGFPYMGTVGGSSNTFVATGHLKAGLYLSPATAIVMADLIQGKTPEIDLSPFAPNRAAPSSAATLASG